MPIKPNPESDNPRRRILLRGAIAACCAVAAPTLFGHGKSALALTTGNVGAASPVAQTPAKLSKETAQYQEQPKGEQKCSDCQHFVPESNTCQVVEGPISPNGWCTLWLAKTS